MQVQEAGNLVWDNAHHHRAASSLLEDIYAEARHTSDSIGKIRGSILFEHPNGRFVLAHDVVGDVAGVLGGEALQSLVLQLQELAVDFDLRRAPRRENQITHLRV